MLKLTKQDGSPVWFRPERIEAIELTDIGARIVTGALLMVVKESPEQVVDAIAKVERERQRDASATASLTGLLANPNGGCLPADFARHAYAQAEAMVGHRNEHDLLDRVEAAATKVIESANAFVSAFSPESVPVPFVVKPAAVVAPSTPVPFCSCGKCDPADPASPTCFPF